MRYPTLDIGAENLHMRVNPIIPQRRDILRSTALLKKTFKGNKKGSQKTTAAAAAAVILSEYNNKKQTSSPLSLMVTFSAGDISRATLDFGTP
jgi:hypothetical protein